MEKFGEESRADLCIRMSEFVCVPCQRLELDESSPCEDGGGEKVDGRAGKETAATRALTRVIREASRGGWTLKLRLRAELRRAREPPLGVLSRG